MRGGLVYTVSITLLMVLFLVGAVASTVALAERGSWLWAFLAAAMQLAVAGQWWLSHREGGVAATTADRFLALVAVTLFVFYATLVQ